MNLLMYFGIFVFKIIEDAIATLRLIVVSNGKKYLGAILQLVTTIIWIVLTGFVLIDFMNDFWKIVAFSFGALFGSYVGSILEEKIALGTNNLIIKIKDELSLIKYLKEYNYSFFKINNNVFMVFSSRKRIKNIIKIVKSIDNNATILCEKIKYYSH